MSKPHAQRIAIATGLPVEEVRELIQFQIEIGEPWTSTKEAIADIEWDQTLNAAWEYAEDYGLPFDHVMGEVLATH